MRELRGRHLLGGWFVELLRLRWWDILEYGVVLVYRLRLVRVYPTISVAPASSSRAL